MRILPSSCTLEFLEDYFIINLTFGGVRTYVIHLLGTYVTILCNWLIL